MSSSMAQKEEESEINEHNLFYKEFRTYWNNLSDKPTTTIRIFDRNEVYTVHGADAVFVAQDYFKTLSVLKIYGTGDEKCEAVWLNKTKFEGLLKYLLLICFYRVELYKTKSPYRSSKNDWYLANKASPGNLSQFEDVLFGQNDQSTPAGIMAIRLDSENGQKVIGAGFVDPGQRSFLVCEFIDSDQFSNLEALLVQLDPKECIITTSDLNSDVALSQVLDRSSALVTEQKRAIFSDKDVVQDLTRLLKFHKGSDKNVMSLPEMQKIHTISSICAIIKYLELTSSEENAGQFSLKAFHLDQYMRLDAKALKALNVMPCPGEGGNKYSSLYGLLNHCCTSQGQRLLYHWIKQPLLDINKIEERLNLVETFVKDAVLRQMLRGEHLFKFPDYQKLAKRFLKNRATLQDCYRIYESVNRLPDLVQVLTTYRGEHQPLLSEIFIDPISQLISDFCKFQEMIETTMDLSQVDEHEFVVLSNFDEDLTDLKKKMDAVNSDINKQLIIVSKDLNLEANKSIKLENNPQLGYYFRITRKDDKVLRNNRNFKTIDTNKNGVRFRNQRLEQLNSDFHDLKSAYSKQQLTVVKEILSIAAGYVEPLMVLNDLLAQMDVLVSFAHAAVCAPVPYTRPHLHSKEKGILCLNGLRHLCVEMQDDVSFISNDVSFKKDKQTFHIITGPNMGGKSTYIRSVGVAVLMAQIGSFVPCDSCEVSMITSILVRVGAGDSQHKALSTFMSEMLETATIVKTATESSLVIIDELGRGTSTYDGFGLAWAISEHIATKIKCFTLFATHFHEMTQLADIISTVNNLHVSAMTTEDKLMLLYKVEQGACDESFGLHVAELAHFPKHVLDFAKRKAQMLEDQTPISKSDSELASKKRRLDKLEGEAIISRFLSDVKSLDFDALGDEELKQKINVLKADVISKNNSYITNLIDKNAKADIL